ncbi:MAG: DUF3570 domain-containing protein [Rhodocyclaceae bacterium]|nr:MAG: DUF3570 domain-containing protein [Rhodocyclaceae bacterium]
MNIGASLLAAALTLPAVQAAHAEARPEYSSIGLKVFNFLDRQPDAERIRVKAQSLTFMTPVAGSWSLNATRFVDTVSGASPAYHTEALSKMHELRRAWDVSATRFSDLGTISFGGSYSNETDYVSRGLSLTGTVETAAKNTTWNFGLNLSHDNINPSNRIVSNETKNIRDLSFGVTQVMTPQDIAQFILGYSHGLGYFSDPYKVFDNRPRERNNTTMLARWNHNFPATDGTARLSYRYYRDSYQIKSHTIGLEYVQPLPDGWLVTPLVRFYSQSAASFYVDLDPDSAPFPTNPPDDALYFTEDQRLSAFGAHTVGIKFSKEMSSGWLADLKIERYEQRSSWKFSGDGSPWLAPLIARSYQFGISRRF